MHNRTPIHQIESYNNDNMYDNSIYDDNSTPIRPNVVPHQLQPSSTSIELSDRSSYLEPTRVEILDTNNINDIDKHVDYVAMSYRIATLLRKADPETYKQCSQFYRNDNSMYIVIIVFLLLICLYMSRYVTIAKE